MKKLLILIGVGAGIFFTFKNGQLSLLNTVFDASPKPNTSPNSNNPLRLNCRIKGNISINTGERIYHVPGQQYYERTRIRPEHGERYFCTEEEARRAGWRKAIR